MVLLKDFLCSDLQPKHYRHVQQKLQLFLATENLKTHITEKGHRMKLLGEGSVLK
jgi:hypothetical protein